jgi:hypothetical protein
MFEVVASEPTPAAEKVITRKTMRARIWRREDICSP